MEYVRFTQEFLNTFGLKRHHVTRSAVRDFARVAGLCFADGSFGKMAKGEPVLKSNAEVLFRYVNERCLSGLEPLHEFSAITEPATPMARNDDDEDGGEDQWDATRGTFLKLLDHYINQLSIGKSSFPKSAEDVRDASAMMMRALGARNGQGKGWDAIQFSESCLAVTLEEHTRLFEILWRESPHSVCFAMQGDVRMGASVVYGCTEDWYFRLRSGNGEFFDIQPAALLPRSDYIILHGLTENSELDLRKNKAKRSVILFKTLMNQLALSCLPLPESSPRILLFSPDAEGVERSTSYHFRHVGNETPRTRKPILEFYKPQEEATDRASIQQRGHYWSLINLLGLIQRAQSINKPR